MHGAVLYMCICVVIATSIMQYSSKFVTNSMRTTVAKLTA